jgi:superfamily I DNA/RNA helicase
MSRGWAARHAYRRAQRKVLWSIFEHVRDTLGKKGRITRAQMFTALAGVLGKARHPPFDYAVVDEAQDFAVAQLRFLAALGGSRPNALFFAGDLDAHVETVSGHVSIATMHLARDWSSAPSW